AHGLTCVRARGAATGSCMAQGTAAGATCDPAHHTSADCSRDDGLYCNETSLQCAAVAFAAVNGPCGNVNGTVTLCQAGALCAPPRPGAGRGGGPPGAGEGTGAPPAGGGRPCAPGGAPPSPAPARCVAPAATADAGPTSGDAGPVAMPGVCTIPDPSMCH